MRETLRADLPADERRWLVLDADFVLGLDLDRVDGRRIRRSSGPGRGRAPRSSVASAARAARDFATADGARSEIEALGYVVTDGPDGQTVQPR